MVRLTPEARPTRRWFRRSASLAVAPSADGPRTCDACAGELPGVAKKCQRCGELQRQGARPGSRSFERERVANPAARPATARCSWLRVRRATPLVEPLLLTR